MGNMLYELHFELDAMLVVISAMALVVFIVLWCFLRKRVVGRTGGRKARGGLRSVYVLLILGIDCDLPDLPIQAVRPH